MSAYHGYNRGTLKAGNRTMHIFLAFITALTGLLYALDRVGIDLGGLNPFYWYRRSKWRKQYLAKPAHQLQRPIEAASVLLVAMVTAEGLVSREQKHALLDIFAREFEKSASEAADMFGGSQFLLRDITDIVAEASMILAPCKDGFTEHQKNTLIKLLRQVSSLEGEPTPRQLQLIEEVEKVFARPRPGQW